MRVSLCVSVSLSLSCVLLFRRLLVLQCDICEAVVEVFLVDPMFVSSVAAAQLEAAASAAAAEQKRKKETHPKASHKLLRFLR